MYKESLLTMLVIIWLFRDHVVLQVHNFRADFGFLLRHTKNDKGNLLIWFIHLCQRALFILFFFVCILDLDLEQIAVKVLDQLMLVLFGVK